MAKRGVARWATGSNARSKQYQHSSNADLRGGKKTIYEGGHRLPFFVRWPGKVQPGSQSAQLICHTDFMATCADILGAKLPDNAAEDSFSILPALLGTDKAPLHETVIHHSHDGSFAIRQGKWKLALTADASSPNSRQAARRAGKKAEKKVSDTPPANQLYDLSTDKAETKNLQAEHPEEVARLTKLLEQIIADGRSTPGATQVNEVPVQIRKEAGKAIEE